MVESLHAGDIFALALALALKLRPVLKLELRLDLTTVARIDVEARTSTTSLFIGRQQAVASSNHRLVSRLY